MKAGPRILRDRTERKDAEDRLANARQQDESEQRYRRMVSEVGDYDIFMVDPDRQVRTWNAGAERLKGYTADEIIGWHISRFFIEEDVRARQPGAQMRTAEAEGGASPRVGGSARTARSSGATRS